MLNRSIIITLLVVIITLSVGILVYKNPSTKSTDTLTPPNKVDTAINILTEIPEIELIQNAVIKSGRKPFFVPEGEQNDIVIVSLRETSTDDQHTSRIDTFHINIINKTITVEDVVSNKTISLDEWKLAVREKHVN